MSRDPLQGLQNQPLEIQVAVLANEVRNLRDEVREDRSEVQAMKRALYGLIFTVLAGMLIFFVTFNLTGAH